MSIDTTSADPLHALWVTLGKPLPQGAPMNKSGTCSRCSTASTTASRLKVVVSDKFTGWANYTHDPDPLWCIPCTWAHTEPTIRTHPWRINVHPDPKFADQTLCDDLRAALPPHVALVVPISRHKHILASAKWGHITTDDRLLTWTVHEARRFNLVCTLRDLGFNEAALSEPAPRYEQLAQLDSHVMTHVLDNWAELEPWRRDPTYLKIACISARAPRKSTP